MSKIKTFLDNPKDEQAFQAAVEAAVRTMFGARGWPFDIDAVKWFAATIDFSLYATEKDMRKLPRFGSRYELLTFALDNAMAEGLILEFGVASGSTINHIARLRPTRSIYGFDWFQGLPEEWGSAAPKGAFRQDALPVVEKNVELVVGLIEDTIYPFLRSHGENIALLHIDVDIYSATKTILDAVGPRLVKGSIIVFDDYLNFPEWRQHEHKAFQEFVEKQRVKYEYLGIVPAFEQLAVRIL